MGLDIGPDAIKQFEAALKDAKVCVVGVVCIWSGSDGVAWLVLFFRNGENVR
jgi:3-phosphoglycerate kinase